MYLRSLFAFLFFPLVFSSYSLAQTTPAADAQSTKQEQEALELLDAVEESMAGVRSLENRVHISSVLGDLLWRRDEKKARAMFEAAGREIVSLIGSLDPAAPAGDPQLEGVQQLRREVLERIARRDPGLALSFLQTTRLPSPWNSVPASHYWSETNLELHLAALIAASDPDLALRTSRAALKKGVSHSLVSVLHQIASRDKVAGQTLHKEIVDHFKATDLSANGEAAGSALSLLASFAPPQADEENFRQLVDLVTSTFLSKGNEPRSWSHNYYSQISSLMPHFEKYAPARVPALRQWAQRANRYADPYSRMHQEISEIVQRGTVDDVLTMADKYPPEHRNSVYEQAIWKAANSGDGNRAREIITEHITDPHQRQQILDRLENQLLWKSISENKIAEARQRANKLSSVEQRIQALISLGSTLSTGKDKEQAFDILAEASSLTNSLTTNGRRATVRLQLAQTYAALDTKECAALLQPLVLTLNQLVAAAVVLDGYESIYLKDGEWSRRSYSSLGGLTNNLSQTLGLLGRNDVAVARALASHIERPEIRVMAQLEIAQAVLGRDGVDNQRGARRIIIQGHRRIVALPALSAAVAPD